MRAINHPNMSQLAVTDILYALSDPTRLKIVEQLSSGGALTCGQLTPERPKSSMSHHFKILREHGLIKTEVRGKEHLNILRRDELDMQFPGLLTSVLAAASTSIKS